MGTIYTRQATGNTSITTNSIQIKEIVQLSDFPTPAASVIALEADTTYIIIGEVDILDNRLDVQVDGVCIKGLDRNKDCLKASTLTGTMITVGDPTLATNTQYSFALENLRLSAPLGKILDASVFLNEQLAAIAHPNGVILSADLTAE